MANKKPMEAKAATKRGKKKFLNATVEHIDIIRMRGGVPLVEAMGPMAFSSRDLSRAAGIYDRMLRDRERGVILCLAGFLVSAGLKKVIVDVVRNNIVDAIVSTGANVVDWDFFESLGFRHYAAPEEFKSGMRDSALREMAIDRIYDTFIDEKNLHSCDETTQRIFDSMELGTYSSRQSFREFGRYLERQGGPRCGDSIVYEASKRDVPIFCPAFSGCSAGFVLVHHLHSRDGKPHVAWDGGKDFYELTQLKMKAKDTGLIMVGGSMPKNFAQDIVLSVEVLGHDAPSHQYAVQVTVADLRDEALSSSTLKEASSWGKLDTAYEQTVYAEATLALPLIVGYAYHTGGHKGRAPKRWATLLDQAPASPTK
jgi:deoxyhypusine synthase